MIDNNMQNLVHFNGHILRELSGARCNGKRIVGVEIACAIKSIGVYCIEKRRVTDISNFIANAVYCIDKDNSASTMLWGCELLIKACQNYIADYPRETLAVIEEILTCIDYAIKNNEVRPKNCVLIIDFLLKQRWITPYCKEYDSIRIPKIIENFSCIRDDMYTLSQNSV